jgi:hypothetical protein
MGCCDAFPTPFSWSFWNPFIFSSCSNQPFHSGDGNVLARERQLYVSAMRTEASTCSRGATLLAESSASSKFVRASSKVTPTSIHTGP